MKPVWLVTCIFTIILSAYGTKPLKSGLTVENLEPVSIGEKIEHTYYSLAYSETNEQALWVYYLLTPQYINTVVERSDNFRADPTVKTGSSLPSDYKNSGTDKGHLCPAADMKLNEISVSETFYMSNMSPQLPGFNRGTWNRLEALIREWIIEEDTLLIVTGPVFRNNLGVIGENKVTIPGYYYKVIFDPTGDMKMISFLLRNSEKPQGIEKSVVSTDSIESLTDIDFFAGLPDDLEIRLEKSSETGLWIFKPDNKAKSTIEKKKIDRNTNVKKQSVQCKGIAKSTGSRCRTNTTNSNGYCSDHQNQVP